MPQSICISEVLKKMKTKKIGILLAAIALAAMVMVPCVNAYQASSYGPEYSSLNTMQTAINAAAELSNMGYASTAYYHSGLLFPNPTAGDARTRFSNDNVFFFDGHGGSGIIQFPDSSAMIARNTGAYPQYLEGSGGALNDVILAVYMACNTGVLSGSYGDLLGQSYTEGIDQSIGWTSNINSAQSSYWSDRFWYWADEGCTPKISASRATSDLRDLYGSSNLGGMNNYLCRGDNSCTMIIDPARAGS
jgi:hypothetical protein